MKKALRYLPILVLIIGCAKTATNTVTPSAPAGTFTGQFKLFHYSGQTGRVDTPIRINSITLNMELATGFKITGDTTLHAASFGGYVVTQTLSQIQFVDKTFPATGTPAKVHLDGSYQYTYDGANLTLAAYGQLDTLEYYYKLVKTSN